jgi:antitoxin CptB
MTGTDRTRERIRWRCRRGLLELDLLLHAFLEAHLERLDDADLDVFSHLLTRTDPDLFDLIMGRQDAANAHEKRILALVREGSSKPLHSLQA